MKKNLLTAALALTALFGVVVAQEMTPATPSMTDTMKPDTMKPDTMKPDTMTKARTGSFKSLHAPTKGSVSLAKNAQGRWTLTIRNLKTEPAPDLKVWLVNAKMIKDTPDLKKGQYIDLGMVASTITRKTFVLPANVKAEQINNVVLWCDQFSVAFASALLK